MPFKQTVEPPFSTPYLIFVCLKPQILKKIIEMGGRGIPFLNTDFAKSSALSIGESIRSTVRKAAKLAVYDEI